MGVLVMAGGSTWWWGWQLQNYRPELQVRSYKLSLTVIPAASARCILLPRDAVSRETKNDKSDVHLPQLQQKSSYLLHLMTPPPPLVVPPPPCFFNRVFGRFVFRNSGPKEEFGVQNHENHFLLKQIEVSNFPLFNVYNG
jgi:hypothetical protein